MKNQMEIQGEIIANLKLLEICFDKNLLCRIIPAFANIRDFFYRLENKIEKDERMVYLRGLMACVMKYILGKNKIENN